MRKKELFTLIILSIIVLIVGNYLGANFLYVLIGILLSFIFIYFKKRYFKNIYTMMITNENKSQNINIINII